MKNEFIEFLNALIAAAPQVVEEKMTDNVKAYIETLSDTSHDKPILTDNGKVVLNYMQKTDIPMFKSRDIAEGLFISPRAVSGAMRKLVTDGFVEKMGENPIIYTLTTKGKEFNIE